MPTYAFLKEFVKKVVSGQKSQTIRRMRKYPPRVGDVLILKCAGKTFGRAVVSEVFPVKFFSGEKPLFMVNGRILSTRAEDTLARDDGISAETLKRFLQRYSGRKNAWNNFIAIRWRDFQQDGAVDMKKRGSSQESAGVS
jgi:hypothetical protein